MKHFQFFILFSFLALTSSAQIDSVKVSIYENNIESGGWEYQILYADSFSNGLHINRLTQSWTGVAWENSSLDTYTYDTSDNVTQKVTSRWISNQWENFRSWNYNYISGSDILDVMMQTWNGSAWVDSILETHFYDAGNDTLILTTRWANNTWINRTKTERVFDPDSLVIESSNANWDTILSVWINYRKYIYDHDSTGAIISVIEQEWIANAWRNLNKDHFGYDSFGNQIVTTSYSWDVGDGVWWLWDQTTYDFNTSNQVISYYWDCFHGACGYAMGNYQYDQQGNLITSYSYSESMGGIPREGRWYYYYFGTGPSPLYVLSVGNLEKCSADTLLIVAFSIGGTAPIQYQWTPSAGLSSDTILNPYVFADTTTQYTLIATDSNGFSDTLSIDIDVNHSPVANISIQSFDTLSFCNSGLLATDSLTQMYCTWYFDGNVQINPLGNYAAHFPIDENGWYAVQVESYGCSSIDSFEVTGFTNPAPAVTIINDCNTLIALSSEAISYQWYQQGVAIPGAIYDTMNVSYGSNYSVSIVDSTGCGNTAYRIFYPMRLHTNTLNSCSDTCKGVINSYVYYATLPLQYVWSTGDTTTSLKGLCSGEYTVTVTDSRGCVLSRTDTVENWPQVNSQVIFSTVEDSLICDGTAALTFTSGAYSNYSYEWSNGANTYSATGFCAGWNYVSIVTNYTQCTQIDSFFVSVDPGNDSCELNVEGWDPYCVGGCNGSAQLTYNGIGPFRSFWISPVQGYTGSGVSSLCPGNYSAFMIDGNGCIDTAFVTINERDSIEGTFEILSATPQNPCSTLVSLSLTNDNGPSQIFWQCIGETGPQAYLCPGTCIVSITDFWGCTADFSFEVPDSILVCSVIPSAVDVTCFGECDASIAVTSNGTAPFSYQWSTGDVDSALSGLCAGTYSVVMTDSLGCVDSASVFINEPSALFSTMTSAYLNCQCTFIPLVTGGSFPYTYMWCNNSTSPVLNDCTPGTCSVVITDANGCQHVDSALIDPPTPITFAPVVVNASCDGCADGSIDANADGGVPPYFFTLQPSAQFNTTGIFNGLPEGTYTLCLTDSNVCTACTTITVTDLPACSVTISTVSNILCAGDCNGSLTANAIGIAPVQFAWSNFDSTATIDSLCANTYVVVMTDSTGCMAVDTMVLVDPQPIVTTYTSNFSNCNCLYSLNTTGGTGPYLYQWCNGNIGATDSSCVTGNCNVITTDLNGCMVSDTIMMNPPPPLELVVQTTGTTCTGCFDGLLNAIVSGGVGPYTFLVTPYNLTCSTCTGLPAGMVTVCVTDSNNCTICVTDTIEDDPTKVLVKLAEDEVVLYPNPFTSAFQLEVSAHLLNSALHLQIKDVTGREIISIDIIRKQTSVSMKNYPPGIYFYELITDDKKVFKGKLIAID